MTRTLGYSAQQLIRYYRFAKANPNGRVLPPGGRKDWDDMPVSKWLRWFWECLSAKMSRGLSAGKGNRAKRRAEALANAKAECKWCGTKTGNRDRHFCDVSCRMSYYS